MKREDEIWLFEEPLTYSYIAVMLRFADALKEAVRFCREHEIDMNDEEKRFSFETYRKGKMIDEKKFSAKDVREECDRREAMRNKRRARREPFPKRKRLSQSA